MKEENTTFAQFIRRKRLESPEELTLKDAAKKIGISLTMYSDIEKGRRVPPDTFDYEMLAELFHLDDREKALLYDLAEKCDPPIPTDPKDVVDITMNPIYGSISSEIVFEYHRRSSGEEKWKRDIQELDKKKREKARCCADLSIKTGY